MRRCLSLIVGLVATASAADYCRLVEQQKPVCKEITRNIKEEFPIKNFKKQCEKVKKLVKQTITVPVASDSCKSSIEKIPNKRPVTINNKVCEQDHGNGYDYKSGGKKPKCRIEKEIKHIQSFDQVTRWKCNKHTDIKHVPVEYYEYREECKDVLIRDAKKVQLEITEKKCHVEKYTREVCDGKDGKQYYKDGHGKNYYGDDHGKKDSHGKDSYGKDSSDSYGKNHGKEHYDGGYDYGKDRGHSKGYKVVVDDYSSGYGGNDKKMDDYSSGYGSYGGDDKMDDYSSGYGGNGKKKMDEYSSGYGYEHDKKAQDYGNDHKKAQDYGNDHKKDDYGYGNDDYGHNKDY